MSSHTVTRINYLLTVDAIRNVQRWWRKAAPSMRDTYKCPVCINVHPVSRAIAGFSCNHIMCQVCHEAWERQCHRENRASTCPTCRAGRTNSQQHRGEYHRTLNDIWISSPATTVADEIIRNALRDPYLTDTLQENMTIHHPPTIRRMIRDTQRLNSIHDDSHSIINDIHDYVSMQINTENTTSMFGYSPTQRAVMHHNDNIDMQHSLGYY